jgi:hypothetical protein
LPEGKSSLSLRRRAASFWRWGRIRPVASLSGANSRSGLVPFPRHPSKRRLNNRDTMTWEKICTLCQTELERFEATLPHSTEFFPRDGDINETFLRHETETDKAVALAVRQFAMTGEWPELSPIQKVMLSFRLDFAASVACLLAQQPAPWTDIDERDKKEHRLCWLMLFAWENEGFPKLQKSLQRLAPKLNESTVH